MEVLEYAMKMELDGKAFYERNARNTGDTALKKIFLLLAEEEEKHYRLFKSMKEGDYDQAAGLLKDSPPKIKEVQNIFNDLSRTKDKTFGDNEQTTWEKALEIEERAESFYREKANLEKNKQKKSLLDMIADEERNHVHMIDTILTYIKFPDAFADSAQFKNFQSLEGH